MVELEDRDSGVPQDQSMLTGTGKPVYFKTGYLDNLVEAEALLEVVGKMVTHHDEIPMNSKTFMGMSILIEKITKLIDVNENLINDSDSIP
ncbi:MAG: hypothetical protein OEZ33_11120 [Gammaproteobacteria bacterium]|nr:hypothetical protein [Gammaproteobacteria bacterium]